jgi:ubiquitin
VMQMQRSRSRSPRQDANYTFCLVVSLVGRCFALSVKMNDTIASVKAQIHEKEHIPIDQQRLTFAGNVLQDARMLCDYNITGFLTLAVMQKLVVDTVYGDTFQLEVDANSTIADIKAKIRDKEGTPPDQQELIFGLVGLEDGRTLSHYNIVHESVLTLVKVSKGFEIECINMSTGDCHMLAVRANYTIDNVKDMLREQGIVPPDQPVVLQLVDDHFGGVLAAGDANIPNNEDTLENIGVNERSTFFFH